MKINTSSLFNIFYLLLILSNVFTKFEKENNITETMKEQKKLLEDLKTFIKGVDDVFIEQWQNKAYIESINSLMDNNKNLFLNIEKFQILFIKSLRLNPKYLELKIKVKKNALNFVTFLKNISIKDEYKFTYDPKFIDSNPLIQMLSGQQQPKEKYTEENSISLSFNYVNLLKDFFINILNMYINYSKLQIQEMELKINVLTKLINNITDYMNNNLMLIKIFIKILYLQDEIEFLMNLRENFNDEQILNKIQKLHKYLDKFFQYVENLSTNEMNIKNMTAIDNIPYLFWEFNNDNLSKSLKKQLELFDKISLKENKYKKFFNKIVKNFFNESLKSSYLFSTIDKLLSYIKFNNKDLQNLIYKKKIINQFSNILNVCNIEYVKSYSTDALDSKNNSFNRKDMLKWDKYKLKNYTSISFSTNDIVDIFLKSINDNYETNQQIHELKDQSINFYNQTYQLTKNLNAVERKILYLDNKINLYHNKLQDNQDKAMYLVKTRQTNQLEIKNHLLKTIDTIIENNHIVKNQIILLYRFNILKIKD